MQFTIKDKRFLTYLGILVSLYILPIILADTYYGDDIRRLFNGVYWQGNARHIGSFIFRILVFFNQYTLDIAPITQIFSAVCLTIAGLFLYKIAYYNLSPFLSSLITFLFIANPFFLENLSYKYDSIIMCFAILFSILSVFFGIKNKKINYFYSLIFIILCLFTYQPMIVITVGLYIIIFLQNSFSEKYTNIKSLLYSSIIVILGYIFYYFITKYYINLGSYTLYHNALLPLNKEGISQFLINIRNSINTIFLLKNNTTILFFLIPFIISTMFTTIFSILQFNKKNIYSFVSGCIILFSPVMIIIFSLLPIIPLQNPVFAPRVFTGFSLILLFSFLGSIYVLKKIHFKKMQYFIIIPAFYCMVLSYSYGNTLKAEQRYENLIANRVINDLDNLNHPNIKIIIGDGQQPYAPESKLTLKRHPFFKIFVLKHLNFGNWLSEDIMKINGYPINKTYNSNSPEVQSKMLEFNKIKPVKSNPIYSMKILGDTALIEYKEQ